LPELVRLEQAFAGQPVRVVAVGTGGTERLTALRAEHAGELAVPEATGPWREALDVYAFPETLVVDTQGRVAARMLGGHDYAAFEAVVLDLLAEAEGAEVTETLTADEPRHGLKARVAGWWVTRKD
jgi:hypothetical protein